MLKNLSIILVGLLCFSWVGQARAVNTFCTLSQTVLCQVETLKNFLLETCKVDWSEEKFKRCQQAEVKYEVANGILSLMAKKSSEQVAKGKPTGEKYGQAIAGVGGSILGGAHGVFCLNYCNAGDCSRNSDVVRKCIKLCPLALIRNCLDASNIPSGEILNLLKQNKK